MTTTPLPESCDVAIIGAGPAGLAAAALTARAGLVSLLLDENGSPGGQIYRSVATSPLKTGSLLGPDYWSGARLVDDMRASSAQYVPGATVWSLSRDREIGVSVKGRSQMIAARRVILATGALERPFPIPGWTLPGVMTVGAAQTMLKASGLVADGRIVLAGTGPLLWLLAWQYLQAGKAIDAILDTTPRDNWSEALRHLPAFLTSAYFRKGLKLLREVRAEVRVVSGVTALTAEGESRLKAVSWRTRSGATGRIDIDNLFLHQGVVPNVNLAMSVGVEHRWDERQACFVPLVGASGATSLDGIAIAGDGAGIAGAVAAEARGKLAAIDAVKALKPSSPILAEESDIYAAFARAVRGRDFLDALYRPAASFRRPEGETLACRCEEISARQIVETVALGCVGPNQAKSFLRCGMGPCQGRMCGLTVTEIIAEARGVTPAEVGYFRIRPPVKPITLAELANLPQDEAAVKAVVRG